MLWLYLAAAVFGGAFVIPMLLGALDLEGDIDFELDADADLDMDLDASGGLGELGDFLGSLLSFRSIVFGSLGFGAGGLALTLFDTNAVGTLIGAVILGLFALVSNTVGMRWLLRTESSSHLTVRDMQGSIAQVVLPLAPGRRGRIRAEIGGATEYFTALPLRDDSDEFEIGEQVVVVEIENGTAKVARLKELDS